MFELAFFAVLLLIVACVILLLSIECFGEGGLWVMAGIVLLAASCALGAWSFMLFVHAVQLA